MKKLVLGIILSTVLIGIGADYTKEINEESSNSQSSQMDIIGNLHTENSWAMEPTAENLLIDSSAVVKVKILSIGNSEFIDKIDSDKPLTAINVEVVESLSGNILSGEKTVYMFGGNALVADMMDSLPETSIKKMGLDTMDKNEINNSYVSYTSDSDYNFEVGKEYLIILDKQVNDMYTIAGNGYGIFVNNASEKSTNNSYTNVLTHDNYNF